MSGPLMTPQPQAQPQLQARPNPGMPKPPTVGTAMNGYRYMGGDPASAVSWQPLNGDEYLKSLPSSALPAIPMIKAYAEGRAPIPTAAALRNPQLAQLLEMTAQYDPTFNAQDYSSRAGTRKDFTSGKAAANLTSFNTVLQHLDDLDKKAYALNNWGGIGTLLNAPGNYLESHVFGDSRVKSFNTARNAVVSELVRAFRGTGGSEEDIKKWEDSFSADDSPQTQHDQIREGLKLLKGRIDALGDQYNRGMGRTQDPVSLLSPPARAIFQRLSGGESAGQTTVGGMPAASAPAAGVPRPQMPPSPQNLPRQQAPGPRVVHWNDLK